MDIYANPALGVHYSRTLICGGNVLLFQPYTDTFVGYNSPLGKGCPRCDWSPILYVRIGDEQGYTGSQGTTEATRCTGKC